MSDGPGPLTGPARPGRLLTFASGGWVLLLSAVVTLGIAAWAISGALLRHGGRLPGDGVHVESYGFDMSTCLVPRDTLAAGGMRKDALRALVDPGAVSAAEASLRRRPPAGTYLVPDDRVVGVVVGGEARAYPLLVLNAHEVVNDALGGVPIAVTYNPLCDSVAVFRREVGGETLELGVSGLLCNSNLLMYDRRPESEAESLWSQIQARAITGPAAAAGRVLELLPASLLTWAAWEAAHPETTVLAREPGMIKRYKQVAGPYELYLAGPEIRFPVRPAPPADGPPAKTRVVAVRGAEGRWRVFTHPQIAAGAASGDGVTWTVEGDPPLRFRYDAAADTVAVEDARSGDAIVAVHCLWFAWHALRP